MDATSAYGVTNLAWLSIQAIPLIVWPSFIGSLLRPEYQPADALAEYLARCLGLAFLALGLMVVVLSGVLPLTSAPDEEDKLSPFATPVILISTLHHTLAGFYCHRRYQSTDQMAYLMGTLGSAGLAVFGLWFVLFAGDTTRLSRKHGFDKNTSGWPFRNSESYKEKKKKGT